MILWAPFNELHRFMPVASEMVQGLVCEAQCVWETKRLLGGSVRCLELIGAIYNHYYFCVFSALNFLTNSITSFSYSYVMNRVGVPIMAIVFKIRMICFFEA